MTANDNDHRGLLPAGLADLLPPDAAREARAIDIAIERFAAFGYERVKPPLVEFEESLLGGTGAGLAAQTFRLMDPVSQRMMGVRPDMTVQVARIAVTRLKHEPRPLRLSYGGNVIRVRGSQLKPERKFAPSCWASTAPKPMPRPSFSPSTRCTPSAWPGSPSTSTFLLLLPQSPPA